MSYKYVYKTYQIKGTPDLIRKGLTDSLLSIGYKQIGNADNILFFRYPSLIFSSKRPLTCISRLSLEVTEHKENVQVKVGVNFAKIRYFTIIIIFVFCAVIPALFGYIQHGVPDVPTPAYLGIPLGIMVHYHVRWRVFRALERLITQLGES